MSKTPFQYPQPRKLEENPLFVFVTQTDGNPSYTDSNPDPHSSVPILVHCHLRWDFVWQRPQQIFSRLAAHHPILFLEDPVEGEGLPRLDVSTPQHNIVRVVPVLPGFTASLSADDQSAATLEMLQHALQHHPLLRGKFHRPIQWFYSPMSANVFANQFDAVAVVYDCMDELANFRFAPPDLKQREDALLARASIVLTGGYQLFKAKSLHHANVHFFGCGVDAAHFGAARLPATPLPDDIASLPGPRIGYFGVIDERLDYELITRVADDFPHASVVMVGPLAKIQPDDLPKRPNIHWLGQRAYADLPSIVKAFDVCLMPFALNAATQYINPTKTLEYMAAGKPVVSTAIQDVVRHFTPVVDVATSPKAFSHAVQQALTAPREELLTQGVAQAQRATWDATVASMRSLVLRSVGSALTDASRWRARDPVAPAPALNAAAWRGTVADNRQAGGQA